MRANFFKIWLKKLAVVLCIAIAFFALGVYLKYEAFCRQSESEFESFVSGAAQSLREHYDTVLRASGTELLGGASDEESLLAFFCVRADFWMDTQGYSDCVGELFNAEGEMIAGNRPKKVLYIMVQEQNGTNNDVQIYACQDEAVMQGAAADYLTYCSDFPDEIVELQMEELYLKNGYFIPGSMQLTVRKEQDEPSVLNTYDYTPEDTDQYVYMNLKDGEIKMFLHPIYIDRSGMEIAERLKDGGYADSEPVRHFFGGVEFTDFRLFSIGGMDMRFAAAGSFHMFEEYKTIFIVAGAAVFAFALMISFIWAYRVYMIFKSQYDMEMYRREKTNAIAHDLKTPLMVISGYAQNLVDNVHMDKREHYVREILSNIEYMSEMIDHILELSKLEAAEYQLKPVSIDLRALTEEIAAKYELLLAEKGNSIEIEGGALIKADEAQFARVLENLIGNSMKYADDASVIKIMISEKQYEIRNAFSGQLGAAAEELWKPFVKGDNSRGSQNGTGIGLTIVKNILDLHGYTLSLKEEQGMFVVRIKLECSEH